MTFAERARDLCVIYRATKGPEDHPSRCLECQRIATALQKVVLECLEVVLADQIPYDEPDNMAWAARNYRGGWNGAKHRISRAIREKLKVETA